MDMDDPRFVLPFPDDPYDSPLHPSLFHFTNPTLSDLSNNNNNDNSNGLPPLPPQIDLTHGHGNALQDVNNTSILPPLPQSIQFGFGNNNNEPFQGVINNNSINNNNNQPFPGQMVQDHFMGNDYFSYVGVGGGGRNDFEAGSSSQVNAVGGQIQPPSNWNFGFGSQNFMTNMEVMPLAYWPEPPVPFTCTCCQVLREFIHTNGVTFNKLEIHGRLGVISHAIHHQNIRCGNVIINRGYAMMQDALSTYYDTICTGLDWAEDLDDYINLNPNTSGGQSDELEQEVENGRITKRNLVVQRERVANMHLSDLSDYFHLPIEEAARLLDLCPTAVKKVCRRGKLARWPHRKVKSIVKQITVLRKSSSSADARTKARNEAEISRLEGEMKKYCGGVAPTAITYPS
ncbi:hypothetical protein RIF29_12526 [Crotalaria pallida]|uniref:RWP-RK domain-containing protein n=1 Tax=Crotalaria pallida TaxID=3830 RepID=A0AAN9IN80_CROPI